MYFDKCLFPVTPEKISIKINGNNKTVNLINEGEINILKKAGLTDIEFEADIMKFFLRFQECFRCLLKFTGMNLKQKSRK